MFVEMQRHRDNDLMRPEPFETVYLYQTRKISVSLNGKDPSSSRLSIFGSLTGPFAPRAYDGFGIGDFRRTLTHLT
jgi:hypothetical protein